MPTDLYQDTVTTIKCHKEHKEVERPALSLYEFTPTPHRSLYRPLSLQLYTVVQHVKHFNDVVEFGENQEFTDDFEYLATGVKSGQPLNTRCLR